MPFTTGTRFGVYDITAQIGEGGMGQVYRATLVEGEDLSQRNWMAGLKK